MGLPNVCRNLHELDHQVARLKQVRGMFAAEVLANCISRYVRPEPGCLRQNLVAQRPHLHRGKEACRLIHALNPDLLAQGA